MFYTKAVISFLFFLAFNFNLGQESIPNISIEDLNKKAISTDLALKDGKYYVLSFWATWCIPCINELDAIADNLEEWTENKIEIIAISTDDSRTKKRVRPMVNGKNWNFKILLDENHDFKRALNIDGIPHTVVTKGKKIISRRVGYSPGEEVDLLDSIIEYQSNNE